MATDIKQVIIEPIQRIDGSTVWNWAVFGEDKLVNEDVAETLQEAIGGLCEWLETWIDG